MINSISTEEQVFFYLQTIPILSYRFPRQDGQRVFYKKEAPLFCLH